MSQTQILTICLSVVIPVSALILSDSRTNEVKETLRAEMKLLNNEVMHRLDQMEGALLERMAERWTRVSDTLRDSLLSALSSW